MRLSRIILVISLLIAIGLTGPCNRTVTRAPDRGDMTQAQMDQQDFDIRFAWTCSVIGVFISLYLTQRHLHK
jgi:hypothetical protein